MEDKQGKPIWIWAAGAALLLLVALAGLRRTGDPGPSQPAQTASGAPARPGEAIKIAIASSSTKQDWLRQATDAFNDASRRDKALQANGHPIAVEILQEVIDGKKVDYRSGTMVSDTLSGKIKPTVLSPGEESWIAQFQRDWQTQHGQRVAREEQRRVPGLIPVFRE